MLIFCVVFQTKRSPIRSSYTAEITIFIPQGNTIARNINYFFFGRISLELTELLYMGLQFTSNTHLFCYTVPLRQKNLPVDNISRKSKVLVNGYVTSLSNTFFKTSDPPHPLPPWVLAITNAVATSKSGNSFHEHTVLYIKSHLL